MRKDYPMPPDYVEYLKKLEWIVSEMINSMDGKINKDFWSNIFEEKNGEEFGPSMRSIETLKIKGWFKYLFGNKEL